MGMEDGSNYFEGGGSGDGGSYGDIGISDFNYGAEGGSFVLDPGFGLDLPDNLSPGGDAIAWSAPTFVGPDPYNVTAYPAPPIAEPLAPPASTPDQLPDLPLFPNTPSFFLPPLEPGPNLADLGNMYGSPLGGDNNRFGDFFDYYSAQGYDDYTAMQMAADAVSSPTFFLQGDAPAPPPVLPDLPEGQFFSLPYVDYWQSPPYIPTFDEGPTPLPPVSTPYVPLISPPMPPSVPGPMPGGSGGTIPIAPGLPPACPGGQYHPYPIGHPQQNACIPFPVATTPKPQPRPSGQQSGGGSSAPRQQQQQQQQGCPTGYCKHPTTGQCMPIPQGYFRHPQTQVCSPRCTTPGTVYDQARGLCVPVGQAVNPLPGSEAPGTELPEGAEGLLAELKKLPWWLWGGLLALFLLGKGEEKKKVTVQHKRAS